MSWAPARYIGTCGAGMLDTTRLNHRFRETSLAAMAWSAGGAYAPSPMIESALTAIADSLSASVAARTRRSRVAGRNVPTGMSTNAGATRLPTSPCSAFDRTETGTITRSVRPRVCSPRASSRSCRPPPTPGEHRVVDRAAQRALDVAEERERHLGGREPAIGPDAHVERTTRRRSHPHDGSEPVERLADDGRGVHRRLRHPHDGLHRVQHQVVDGVGGELEPGRRRLRHPRLLRRRADVGVG